MSNHRFEAFFQAATGHAPFDYQRRLARGDHGTNCLSLLIDLPTGLASLLAEYVIMSRHGRGRKALGDEIPKAPKVEKETNAVRMLERMREFYLVYPQLAEGIPSSLMTKSLSVPLPSKKSSSAMTKSTRGKPKQPSPLPSEQVLRFSWTKLIELILCTNKDQTRVDYATAGLDRKMFVSRYLNVLPSTEVIQHLNEDDAARWLQNHRAEE